MDFPYRTGHAFPLFLAPMSGVSESACRLLCRARGSVSSSVPPRLVAAVAIVHLIAFPGKAQVLHGTVVDTTSEQRLAGAYVLVFNAAGTKVGDTVASADGRFTFHLPTAANNTLRASAFGYATVREPVAVSSAFELTVLVQTAPNPVRLDPYTVVGEKQVPFLAEVGFYHRQRMGFGHFVTRADIDRRGSLVMSDLLRGLLGVRVTCSPPPCDVEMRAARTTFTRGPCRPTVVLDGVVVLVGGIRAPRALKVDEILNPFNIEAVEVYPSAAGVPVQYGGYMSPCGAIVAWSRRGGAQIADSQTPPD